MAKLIEIAIEGFRSIQDQLVLKFPDKQPVILIGENNAGKSNVIRAIELLFGEYHPKYKKLDDFDHRDRDTNNPVTIEAKVAEFKTKLGRDGEYTCGGFKFKTNKGGDHDFVAIHFEDGNVNKFVNNNLREELMCVVVNSEQNLSYQLSYASKFTLLSKVTKSFHDKLTTTPERVSELKGLFESVKKIFSEVKEFSDFTSNMSSIGQHMISNMQHALSFDFSAYDPSNYFRTLRVHPTEDGQTRAFEELGTGQQQILALAFAHAYAKSFLGQGLIFILDEPESHLHPLAQKWLAKRLFTMCEDGLQVVITTHSPHFINLLYLEGVNLIRKDESSTISITANAESLLEHCLKTGANPIKSKLKTVVPFYANNATAHILTGFFARKIILVEGLTEELALPVLFERMKYDLTENCIEVIGVGGKGNLAKWWRLFTLYKLPVFVCFDNDGKSDDTGAHRVDTLKAIGLNSEELQKVLGISDWNVSDNYCVFGIDFESTMRTSFEDYKSLEEENRATFGTTSKHIVAKETAKQVNLSIESPGRNRLLELIEKLSDLKC